MRSGWACRILSVKWFWLLPRWLRAIIAFALFVLILPLPVVMVGYYHRDGFIVLPVILGLLRIGAQVRHWTRANGVSGNPPSMSRRGDLPAGGPHSSRVLHSAL